MSSLKSDSLTVGGNVTADGGVVGNTPISSNTNSTLTGSEQLGGIINRNAGSGTSTIYFASGTNVLASMTNPVVGSSIEWILRNTTTTGGFIKLSILNSNARDSIVTPFTTTYIPIYQGQSRRIRSVITDTSNSGSAVVYYDMGIVDDFQTPPKNIFLKDRAYPVTTIQNMTASSSGTTLSFDRLAGGVIMRTLNSASITDNFTSAASIIYTMGNLAQVGHSWEFYYINVANGSSRTATINPGSGSTMVTQQSGGTVVINNGEGRHFKGVVTNVSSAAVSYYDLGKLTY